MYNRTTNQNNRGQYVYFLDAYHPIWPAWPPWSPGPPESPRPPRPPWPPDHLDRLVHLEHLKRLAANKLMWMTFCKFCTHWNDNMQNLQMQMMHNEISKKLPRRTICKILQRKKIQNNNCPQSCPEQQFVEFANKMIRNNNLQTRFVKEINAEFALFTWSTFLKVPEEWKS